MEMNQIIENVTTKSDETNANDIQDNLNTSLTSLSLNEKPIEATVQPNQPNDSENKKEAAPTKIITLPLRIIPAHNVPEKILLCLDTCTDLEYTPFKIGDGSTYPPLYMLKRIIDIFVQNKNFIDSRHEFALLTLDSKDIRWIKDFTSNPCDIINSMKEVTECEPSEEFRLSMLLNAVWENVNLTKHTTLSIPPPYVVRLILLYSRSNCTRIVKENYEELLNNPYFTIDVIMTHEESPIEKYQEIFNCLQELDDKSYSYKFEVGRNVTMLHDCMAKLLSHPLQRPIQSCATYEFNQEKRKLEKEELEK